VNTSETSDVHQDHKRGKAVVNVLDISEVVDIKVQEKIPAEMDKPMSHSSSMVKTVECEISRPTMSKELVGRSW